MDEQPLLVTST